MKSFRSCPGLMLAALLLALPACQTPEDAPRPAQLVPKEKIVPLLADIHELEARIESSRLAPDSARALFLAQQKTLFWKREISDSAFYRSYRYYSIHGKDLHDIYGGVIDTLTARQHRLDPAAAARDSVEAANKKWAGQ